MKKKLLVKRIFSIIVAIALLISAVPVSLAVQNLLVEETTAKIVWEVTELREESVKRFLCEDGSYIAATYSAPVHYKENGEWKEIDNSLSLDRATLSESGKPISANFYIDNPTLMDYYVFKRTFVHILLDDY